MANSLPRARRDDLLIEDVLDEVLIYDLRSQQAHCLNAAAAAIWRACDGQASVDALAAVASEATSAPWDEGVVRLALDQLQERGLLDTVASGAWRTMSRREMIERVAVPAMLLPLITRLTIPTPAMAQSCPPGGGPQGPQGIQGPQGDCVCVGAQGPQGPTGPQGAPGFQGDIIGPQGFQGTTGFQGDCGGFQGPTGPQGPGGGRGPGLPTDCQGPQGLQGAQGPSTLLVCGPQS